MNHTPAWFAAVEDEEPALFDALGQVRGIVYQQESADAIAAAMALAIERCTIVFVYDAQENFIGTAYGY